MTTWDEIKEETEKRATRLWADDDEDEHLPATSATLLRPQKDTHINITDEHLHNTQRHSKQNSNYSELKNATIETQSDICKVSDCVVIAHSKHEHNFSKSFVDAIIGDGNRPHSVVRTPDFNVDAVIGEGDTVHSSFNSNKKPTERFFHSQSNVFFIEPGDPLGIRSIQSIMMSATQNNLSHFHTAGMSSSSSSSSLGRVQVPSAADAMNSIYTKTNTSMKFTMHSPDRTNPMDKFEQLRYLKKHLVGASLGQFVRKIGSNITEIPDRENIWYKTKTHYSGFESTEVPGILLRIYIDYNKMHSHGLTLENLAQEIFGSDCSWNVSPDFMGMIDISVQVTYISQWLSRIKHRVCGTSDVLSCDFIESDSDTSSFFTRGTNVLAACKVPGIDKSTIELNNVISAEKHFGIEAATSVLAKLTGDVIVSDFMARTGKVLHFSKYSNEVNRKGLLTSMGFERPKDDIKREINTYSTSTSKRIESVYEHIITGKDPPLGFSVY